jgi:putative chitobiose transport system permease protein
MGYIDVSTPSPTNIAFPTSSAMRRFGWLSARLGRTAVHYALLIAIGLLCVYPFWWTLILSLSTKGNVFQFPPPLLPNGFSFQNYFEVFRVIDIPSFYKNSMIITAFTIVGTLVVSSMAAYPLARLRFPGRTFVFYAIIATMILPSDVNFLVNFLTVVDLGLSNTYAGVVLPNLAGALGIFLMKQAFEEVPGEIIEAAKMDGANEWQIFWRIMLPLALPTLGALAILTMVTAWNQYIWPAIVMRDPSNFPLSVGVLYLSGTFMSNYRIVAAGAILTIVPTLLVFLFTQRYFLRGFEGGVK